MRRGTNFVRPTALEAEVAEAIVDLVDAAEMVKFAKNGSDVLGTTVLRKQAANFRILTKDPGLDFDPAWRP